MKKIEDKILGMLVGNAIGDALGAPYEEGRKKGKIKNFTGKIELPIETFNNFQGKRFSEIGSTTDDNQMTIALADTIVNGYTRNNAVKNYLEFAKKCSFVTGSVKELFKTPKTIRGYSNRYSDLVHGLEVCDEIDKPYGNEYLMRACPLIVFKSRNNARIDAEITSPGETNKRIAEMYHRLLRRTINDEEYEIDIPDDWKNRLFYYDKKNQVFVQDRCGWKAFELIVKVSNKDFQSGIEYAIKKGGNTNGTIVGSYLGAKFGFREMMKNEITFDNWKLIRNTHEQQVNFYCPDKFHPWRIPDLAKELARIYED